MSADSHNNNCKYSISLEMPKGLHFDLLSMLDLGIVYFDKNGKITHFSRMLEDLTGITESDVIGSDLASLSVASDRSLASFFCQIFSARQENDSEKHRYVKLITLDGSLKYFSCEFFPYSCGDGVSQGTLCVLKDKTVKTVCSNEHIFADNNQVMSTVPFVSFLWKGDDVWSVEYVSENIVQFGYSPEDFVSGKLSYADIIHPDHLGEVKDAVAVCGGNYFSKEYRILKADGESCWVLERSYAIRNEAKTITHFHGAILDINERKSYEDELRRVNLQEKALAKLGEKALSCTNIDRLMDYAVELVAKTFDMKYCQIMESLPDGRFLLRYGYGISAWCVGSVVVDGNEGSQAGFTMLSGEPLVMPDITCESRFKIPHYLREHSVVSGASVIIGNRQDSFGILCIHDDRKRQFIEHDINFLQSVSNVLAESISLIQSFGSLKLYKKLINHSNDYIMVLDTVTKKFSYVSERVIHDLGYSESEIMSRTIFDPECFMETLDMLDVISRAADEGSFLVCSEFTKKNGKSFPVNISFSFVENEGKIYMVLIGRDVTEQKKTHGILQESETKLSAIFDTASDLICVSDFEGTILQVNKAMAKILGYKSSELLGRPFEEFLCPDFRMDLSGLMAEVLDKGLVIAEIDFMGRDGGSLPMEVKAQLMEYNGQKHVLSIGRDISERRILEQAIKDHSKKLEHSNEIKNLFADVTSHDLIGSVSLIEGFSDYLSELEDDEEKMNILTHIKDSTVKLRKTIDYASVFAKMNSSEDMIIHTLDLRHLFHNSLDRLLDDISAKKIEIGLQSPATCPAYANPILEEVFFNLLSNAIKYSPTGSEIAVNITAEDYMWKVSVSDLGPGISDKDKAKIFDRFSRATTSGVNGKGLGLAIARMALKCHGQELHVSDNKAGKGSTFWFNVRVSDEFKVFQ